MSKRFAFLRVSTAYGDDRPGETLLLNLDHVLSIEPETTGSTADSVRVRLSGDLDRVVLGTVAEFDKAIASIGDEGPKGFEGLVGV